MTSQDKLIKQGIKYTDSLFDEISRRLENGIRQCDTLEEFLSKYKEYTDGKGENNPLVVTGYKDQMLKIILAETNNHKFSRPSQKELIRVTIENQVGELIKDVGEDIKESVREVVKDGYNNNLSQDKIAANISNRVSAIKGRRARTIARTEIARTATISDYVINAEMGATHFYVECRNTACPICKKAWFKKPNLEDIPNERGMTGDKYYPMSDTSMLPPLHPNCRCVPYFVSEEDGKKKKPTPTPEPVVDPTPEQLKKNLRPGEREKYNQYKRNIERQKEWLSNNPNASAEEIAKHKKRLAFLQGKFDELRRKALGGSGGVSKPKPTPKPKPKPKEPKPKATPKPKAEPKTVKEYGGNKLTAKELKSKLSDKDYKKFQKYSQRIIDSLEKLKRLDKTNPNRIPLEYKIKLSKDVLDKLEEKAINPPKPKKETVKPKKLKSNVKHELEAPFDKSKFLTKEQLDKMDFKELAKHHNAEYKGIQVYDHDGKKYHTIEQTFDDGRTFVLRFEEGAVKSYTKKGITTPNEIIHEVFKVPEALRIETKEIWFKNTQHGIHHKYTKSGYDTLGKSTGGYNTRKLFPDEDGDYEHRIVINPKYFKGGGKGINDMFIQWIAPPTEARNWKMTIFHEFTHSGDLPREAEHSHSTYYDAAYRKIVEEEKGFTWYANSKYHRNDFTEDYAEHGGYIAYMESNPSEQDKTIKIEHYEDGKIAVKRINYEEYKKIYPKHYEYFMKRFKEGF